MLMTRGLDRINLEQRLYVLTEGKGYTCLGFDYTFQVSVKVARWAGVPGPDPEKLGTPKAMPTTAAFLMRAESTTTEAERDALPNSPQVGGPGRPARRGG